MIAKKKYRTNFLLRCGIHYPEVQKGTHPPIWIHAVSVGETKAISSLARAIKRQFPHHPLIISNTTETGHAEAKRSLPFADAYLYMPFDFASIVAPIVAKISPSLVILCESDFWMNFLYFSKKRGAKIVLVNGKMSEKSMKFYSYIPFFSVPLFHLFDMLCVQNELYKNRFLNLGVPSDKLFVTGNLKLDEEYPQLPPHEIALWRQKFGFDEGQKVLTIGSTHASEELLLINILKELWVQYPSLRVILVPRHPERFSEVGHLLQRSRVSWINYSDIIHRNGSEQVILMNSMGLLRLCYQLSDFACVGGSFISRVGGHNILEPLWYGKPVLFGPYMHAQTEFVELVNRYGAGTQVTQEELPKELKYWLESPSTVFEMGQKGKQLVSDLKGATQKTLDLLQDLL